MHCNCHGGSDCCLYYMNSDGSPLADTMQTITVEQVQAFFQQYSREAVENEDQSEIDDGDGSGASWDSDGSV